MSYSPTLGRFLERDPIGYPDGMNPYEMEKSNPTGSLDPMGLQAATTQPTSGPSVGPVTTSTGPNTRFQLFYHGPGRPTFYQTIEIEALCGFAIPDDARQNEMTEHGGTADPTLGPVGDNQSGDPSKPYDGVVVYYPGGATMEDAPNFNDPAYPDGFQGQKSGHIRVVVQEKVVAEFNFVTTQTARGPGETVITPAPTTRPTTNPTTPR